MALTIVTRTLIARPRYVLPFVGWSLRSAIQAQRSRGFVAGALRVGRGPTFWTMTTWADGRAMTGFRNSGSHGAAMSRLARWASEASSAAWRSEDRLPSWDEAFEHLARSSRHLAVDNPSADHLRQLAPSPGRGLVAPIPARGRAHRT